MLVNGEILDVEISDDMMTCELNWRFVLVEDDGRRYCRRSETNSGLDVRRIALYQRWNTQTNFKRDMTDISNGAKAKC